MTAACIKNQYIPHDGMVSPAHVAVDTGSDDDLPLSEILKQTPLECDMCHLHFHDFRRLKKHFKKYNYTHRYYKCCDIVDGIEHGCQSCEERTGGKRRKRRSRASVGREGSKPFACTECSSSFYRKGSLKNHLRIIHNAGQWKCRICEELFHSNEEYKEHFNMHDPDDKIVCKNCQAEFPTLNKYRHHAKLYPLPHNYPCTSCARNFYSQARFNQHACIFKNGGTLFCACGQVLSSYPELVVHAKGTKPFHCCSCKHATSSFTGFVRHLRSHTSRKVFKCVLCEESFTTFGSAQTHLSNIHGIVEYIVHSIICGTCGLGFQTEAELKSHCTLHEDLLPCPQCGKYFRSSRLEGHKAKHKLSSCLCPDCGKLFESHNRLSHHITSMHKSHPVKCDLCDKVLKTKKILQEHLKTHLLTDVGKRIAQAICPHCGMELAQKGSLARHILLVHERNRLVQNDEPRLCKDCGMLLPNKAKYYSHRRQHRAMVERYPCSVCSREFNKKQNLMRHMRLLHDSTRKLGDRNFTCEVCSRTFRERKNLSRHYRLVHKFDESFLTTSTVSC